MQKLRSKLGLVVVLSCLTLAIGLVASVGSASANGSGHHPVSKISPRISMKILSGRFKFHSHYVQRVVLSGVGPDADPAYSRVRQVAQVASAAQHDAGP